MWATIGLSDGTGYRTMFAHLSEAPSVYEGQAVEAGTLLGYVGSTGMSTGPHLHWVLGGQLENRWLARDAGNVEVLDYCAGERGLFAPTGSGSIAEDKHTLAISALQDARAALDRALAALY